MTNIGIKIKTRREELGMSQDELAEKMGYKSRSTIAKIEKGVNDVVQANIVKFASVLNTSVAYLMGWDEEENTKDAEKSTENDGLSENTKALIDFAKSVPEDKAEMILRVMKSILGDD